MSKNSTEKAGKENIESMSQKIQSLLQSSNDLGKILSLFSNLADACILQNSITKEEFQRVESIFLSIESKIKWQKDPKKNLGKCAFYRKMSKVYKLGRKHKRALKCYITLFTNFLKNTTPRTIYVYDDMLKEDYKESEWMATLSLLKIQFHEETAFILDLPTPYPLPTGFYQTVYESKAKNFMEFGQYWKAWELTNRLFETQVGGEDSLQRGMSLYLDVAICEHHIGNNEECLEACESCLGSAEYLDKDTASNGKVMTYIYKALFYKAISLSELKDPKTNVAFKAFLKYRQSEAHLFSILEENSDMGEMLKCAQNQFKIGPYNKRIQKVNVMIDKALKSTRYNELEEARKILRNEVCLATQDSIAKFVQVSYMIAYYSCYGQDQHLQALDIYKDIHFILLQVIDTKRVFTKERVILRQVECLIFHCHEYDEALSTLEHFSRFFPILKKHPLSAYYIQLLIYKKQYSKALKKLKKNQRYIHERYRPQLISTINSLKNKEKSLVNFKDIESAIIERNAIAFQELTFNCFRSHYSRLKTLPEKKEPTEAGRGINHFHNSLSISLFARKKLRFEVSRAIFKQLDEKRTL